MNKELNQEFFEALAMLEKEKGIPMQYLIEKIEAAISIAIKRDEDGAEDNVVEIDPETGRFYVAVRKTVVEEIEDPGSEILKEEAAKYKKNAMVGDIIEIPLETHDFGRIAAQAAKHVIARVSGRPSGSALWPNTRAIATTSSLPPCCAPTPAPAM